MFPLPNGDVPDRPGANRSFLAALSPPKMISERGEVAWPESGPTLNDIRGSLANAAFQIGVSGRLFRPEPLFVRQKFHSRIIIAIGVIDPSSISETDVPPGMLPTCGKSDSLRDRSPP